MNKESWIKHGGGQELWDEIYAGFNVKSMASLGMNLEFWNSLSAADQAMIQLVADAEMSLMTADFTGDNGLSLTQLIDEFGVQPTRLPDDVWNALAETPQQVVAGVADDDDIARRIYDSFDSYRQLAMGTGPVSQAEYLSRRRAEDLFQFI